MYIEKIYQLPNIWCPLSTSDLSEINLKQRTADENIVFGCFNNIKKINKDVIFAWSQILKNTSNSKLYLKSNEFNNLKFKDYFRVDLKISWRMNTKKMTHEIGLDLVNILNTKNLLSLAYAPRLDPNDISEPTAERFQLGFLPIFYYKIDFKAKKKE